MVCTTPVASAAVPVKCSSSFTSNMPKIEKAVSAAYEAFNMGDPKKTPGLMRQAIAAARKALKGSSGETAATLKRFIAIGDSPYSVSMMASTLVDLQDLQIRGC